VSYRLDIVCATRCLHSSLLSVADSNAYFTEHTYMSTFNTLEDSYLMNQLMESIFEMCKSIKMKVEVIDNATGERDINQKGKQSCPLSP